MGLVKIRVSGNLEDIETIQRFICEAEAVMKFPKLLSTSADYLNRDGSGVRRYLDLLVESDPGVVHQDATIVNPKLPYNSDR